MGGDVSLENTHPTMPGNPGTPRTSGGWGRGTKSGGGAHKRRKIPWVGRVTHLSGGLAPARVTAGEKTRKAANNTFKYVCRALVDGQGG